MTDENKRNLLYFEGPSMRALYSNMKLWQTRHHKRLLSANIQKDGDTFCCIALSNPTEVVICDGSGAKQAAVSEGYLEVKTF